MGCLAISNPCVLRRIIGSTLQCSKSIVRCNHNNVIAKQAGKRTGACGGALRRRDACPNGRR
jgi:hypothetical protein